MFTVSLSGQTNNTVTVVFFTANGSAVAPGDYTATTVTLTFNPCETTKSVSVWVNVDDFESPEDFTGNLSGPVNAVIVKGQGVVSIRGELR